LTRALLPALALALALAACQPQGAPTSASAVPQGPGAALAQRNCSGCHAIGRYDQSPNPRAPAFAAIANSEGLTEESLTAWLRDAHNYPQQMEFTLGAREVEALVDHILALRDPNYRPPV
jgi:mono/diheme cytochrome c family protein